MNTDIVLQQSPRLQCFQSATGENLTSCTNLRQVERVLYLILKSFFAVALPRTQRRRQNLASMGPKIVLGWHMASVEFVTRRPGGAS